MQYVKGNIWEVECDWRMIPTNGVVKSDGTLVMGAGLAKQAVERYPELPGILGSWVRYMGNVPGFWERAKVISMPTKDHWKDPSRLDLILKGLRDILQWPLLQGDVTVVLPPLGCGLGGLKKEEVLPELEKILDDRFILCDW